MLRPKPLPHVLTLLAWLKQKSLNFSGASPSSPCREQKVLGGYSNTQSPSFEGCKEDSVGSSVSCCSALLHRWEVCHIGSVMGRGEGTCPLCWVGQDEKQPPASHPEDLGPAKGTMPRAGPHDDLTETSPGSDTLAPCGGPWPLQLFCCNHWHQSTCELESSLCSPAEPGAQRGLAAPPTQPWAKPLGHAAGGCYVRQLPVLTEPLLPTVEWH